MANVAGWRDEASQCRYPFNDGCPLADRSGNVLPTSLFVDARLNVPVGAGDVFLRSVARAATGVSGVVAFGATDLGVFTAVAGTRIAPVRDAYGVTRGVLVLGDELSLPVDSMAFAPGAAVFSAGCLFRYPAAVLRSISITDPDGLSGFLSGCVAFVEGTGVWLSTGDDLGLSISAIGAVNTDLSTDCFGPLGDPVGSINGQALSAAGDFRIEPDHYAEPLDPDTPRQILRVQPGTNSLTIGLARGA